MSTEAGLEYRKVNREVRRKMKAAEKKRKKKKKKRRERKKEWIGEQFKNIEKGLMSGNSRSLQHPRGSYQDLTA